LRASGQVADLEGAEPAPPLPLGDAATVLLISKKRYCSMATAKF